jgi:nitrate reductase NapAB chaperone NapD
MIVAGIVIETIPGAAGRVAARLVTRDDVEVTGGDGNSRVAIVCEAADGAALEAFAEELVARDEEILGVYPTYVGDDQDPS